METTTSRRGPMTESQAAYTAGWLEGATIALWPLVGERLSAEAVAEMEAKAHALAEHVCGGEIEREADE